MPKAKRKVRTQYVVFAEYDADLYFEKFLYRNKDMDTLLETAVRKESDGSGCGLGGRDISWSFSTQQGATNAVKRIQALAKRIHKHINVDEYHVNN